MDLSFNATVGASQSTTLPELEGNAIHEVTFNGCIAKTIIGTKEHNKGVEYPVIEIKFSNPKGYFTQTYFEPKEADAVRRPNPNKPGAAFESPSNIENMMLFFKHLIDATNPELGKAIDSKEKVIPKTDWKGLIDIVTKATEVGKGKKTNIKLVKDKAGKVRLPFFSGLTKEAPYTARIMGNFIGENVYFSAYEKTQMEKQAIVAPKKSNSLDLEMTIQGSESIDSDMDFNL